MKRNNDLPFKWLAEIVTLRENVNKDLDRLVFTLFEFKRDFKSFKVVDRNLVLTFKDKNNFYTQTIKYEITLDQWNRLSRENTSLADVCWDNLNYWLIDKINNKLKEGITEYEKK